MSDGHIMRVDSPRYGTPCAGCGSRIRVGKHFVIDPVDPKRIYHQACAPENPRRA